MTGESNELLRGWCRSPPIPVRFSRKRGFPPREKLIYELHSDREDYYARDANLVLEHLFCGLSRCADPEARENTYVQEEQYDPQLRALKGHNAIRLFERIKHSWSGQLPLVKLA